MKNLALLLLLIILTSTTKSQVKANFVMSFLPDNSWNLKLNKDFSYLYEHWSGFGESPTLIDSGKYKIEDGKIKFESIKNNKNSSMQLDDEYYFTDLKIKRNQHLLINRRIDKKFNIFRHRYFIITTKPFQQNWIEKK